MTIAGEPGTSALCSTEQNPAYRPTSTDFPTTTRKPDAQAIAPTIIDTHAHLTDKSFIDQLDEFLRQARDAGVSGILTVGTTLASSRQAISLAEEHPEIRAAVGLHPNNCCEAEEDAWRQIELLSQHPRVAALGETGLDRYWDDCPWDVQVDYFIRHLTHSRSTGLPVVIHTRDCAEETLEILQQQSKLGPLHGVMHSFTGPMSVAEGCLELGLYISFAGMVTFKNAADIADIAKRIPDDRILVETDSPFLTPHPFRGKRPNHPALVAHTLKHVAGLRNVTEEAFAAQTTANAQRLFGNW